MTLYALTAAGSSVPITPAAEGTGAGLVFNGFWMLIAAVNFIFFLFVVQQFAFGPVSRMLETRRQKIEDGLRDAEAARRAREEADTERAAALTEARREANEIINRAQKVAQETRDADIAATREELERMRERAAADIDAEKQRAMTALRAEVADLALDAAGRVVRESMSDERQRRLVQEFLAESGASESRS